MRVFAVIVGVNRSLRDRSSEPEELLTRFSFEQVLSKISRDWLVVARGRTLPEAWERSLLALAEEGIKVFTEYGESSFDAPAVIVVKEPLAEPRVYLKGIVAGSLRGLFDYVADVMDGVRDHLVEKPSTPTRSACSRTSCRAALQQIR